MKWLVYVTVKIIASCTFCAFTLLVRQQEGRLSCKNWSRAGSRAKVSKLISLMRPWFTCWLWRYMHMCMYYLCLQLFPRTPIFISTTLFSIYSAELCAIKLALLHIPKMDYRSYMLFSDSMSSLQARVSKRIEHPIILNIFIYYDNLLSKHHDLLLDP